MIYDLSKQHEIDAFNKEADYLTMLGKSVSLEVKKHTRSTLQNAALHLFFKMLAEALNESHHYFHYSALTDAIFEIPWTPELIKDRLWKPIQKHMFDIDSTTKIDTGQINAILDVLIAKLGEMKIDVRFPNRFDQYVEYIKNHRK